MSTTYRVVATREGTSWLADAPDVPGAHTWAKNLPSLHRSIREAIALALDLPDDAEADMSLTCLPGRTDRRARPGCGLNTATGRPYHPALAAAATAELAVTTDDQLAAGIRAVAGLAGRARNAPAHRRYVRPG